MLRLSHKLIINHAQISARKFHMSRSILALKPFVLADIGEGIAEVELMQWFVKQGDKIKAFDKICEVQSDKATVEITSRFDGTVATVHHKEGDIVKVV
jgi:2-oxoisovalerate dehydrogenase E2 component (dihydrolipoyl transacylase)